MKRDISYSWDVKRSSDLFNQNMTVSNGFNLDFEEDKSIGISVETQNYVESEPFIDIDTVGPQRSDYAK